MVEIAFWWIQVTLLDVIRVFLFLFIVTSIKVHCIIVWLFIFILKISVILLLALPSLGIFLYSFRHGFIQDRLIVIDLFIKLFRPLEGYGL
jgi:hypothetical protein